MVESSDKVREPKPLHRSRLLNTKQTRFFFIYLRISFWPFMRIFQNGTNTEDQASVESSTLKNPLKSPKIKPKWLSL